MSAQVSAQVTARVRAQAMSGRMDDGRGRTALLIVVAAESVFFGTLILSYLFLRAGQPNWPFNQPSPAQLLVPSLNTLILMLSGVAAWASERAILSGKDSRLKLALTLTIVLGAIFIGGQVLEFARTGMHPSDQAFGGVFFALMGFHALHLLAGMVVLVICLARAGLGDFTPARHEAVTLGAWFWYFVVVVWLVLFTALFLV
jgi:heme/copper-type cytochrome/quinol oxidase subunit 3